MKVSNLIIGLLLLGFSLQAQNTELKNAEDAFARQDFAKTMQHLSILFNAPEQLRGNESTTAYLLRAKCYINLLHNAIKAENETAIELNKDNYIMAYQDILDARGAAVDDAAKKEVQGLADYLQAVLRQSSADFLTTIYSNTGLNKAAREALLDEAQRYLMASLVLSPEDYLSNDFYGQVMMLKRSREDALKYFNKAIEYYKPGKEADSYDFGHFRVYANMAILYMQEKAVEPALAILEKGKEKIQQFGNSAKLTEAQKSEYERIFQSLSDVEMDVYLNAPTKREEALLKFKTAVNDNPKDYNYRMAYAGLLDKIGDKAAAIEQYKIATEINEKGLLAYYNWAVLYVNEGLEYQQKADGESEETARTAWAEKAIAAYTAALAPLQAATAIAPNDLPTLEALVMVTARLKMEEAYKMYRSKKKELEKNK